MSIKVPESISMLVEMLKHISPEALKSCLEQSKENSQKTTLGYVSLKEQIAILEQFLQKQFKMEFLPPPGDCFLTDNKTNGHNYLQKRMSIIGKESTKTWKNLDINLEESQQINNWAKLFQHKPAENKPKELTNVLFAVIVFNGTNYYICDIATLPAGGLGGRRICTNYYICDIATHLEHKVFVNGKEIYFEQLQAGDRISFSASKQEFIFEQQECIHDSQVELEITANEGRREEVTPDAANETVLHQIIAQLYRQALTQRVINRQTLEIFAQQPNIFQADFVALISASQGREITWQVNLQGEESKKKAPSREILVQVKKHRQARVYRSDFTRSQMLSLLKEVLAVAIEEPKLLFKIEHTVFAAQSLELKQVLKSSFASHGHPLGEDFGVEKQADCLKITSHDKSYLVRLNWSQAEVYSLDQKQLAGILYWHISQDNPAYFQQKDIKQADRIAQALQEIFWQVKVSQEQQKSQQEVIDAHLMDMMQQENSHFQLGQITEEQGNPAIWRNMRRGKLDPRLIEKLRSCGLINGQRFLKKEQDDYLLSDFASNQQIRLVQNGDNIEILSSSQGIYRPMPSGWSEYSLWMKTIPFRGVGGDRQGKVFPQCQESQCLVGYHIDSQGHDLKAGYTATQIASLFEVLTHRREVLPRIVVEANEYLFRKYRTKPLLVSQHISTALLFQLKKGSNFAEDKKAYLQIVSVGSNAIIGKYLEREKRYMLIQVPQEDPEQAVEDKRSLAEVTTEIHALEEEIAKKKMTIEGIKQLQRNQAGNRREAKTIILESTREIRRLFSRLEQLKKEQQQMPQNKQGSCLGLHPWEEFTFFDSEIEFTINDFLFIYSDGISDQLGDMIAFTQKHLDDFPKMVAQLEQHAAKRKDDYSYTLLTGNPFRQ